LLNKKKSNYFSEILQTGASQFTTNASKLKRKYWWKNLKVSLVITICKFPSERRLKEYQGVIDIFLIQTN
jgi:hypothetical protein